MVFTFPKLGNSGLSLGQAEGRLLADPPPTLLQQIRNFHPDQTCLFQHFKTLKLDGATAKKGTFVQIGRDEEDNIWKDQVLMLDSIVEVHYSVSPSEIWLLALPFTLEKQPSGHAKLVRTQKEWFSMEEWTVKRLLRGFYHFENQCYLNTHLETDLRRAANIISFRFEN